MHPGLARPAPPLAAPPIDESTTTPSDYDETAPTPAPPSAGFFSGARPDPDQPSPEIASRPFQPTQGKLPPTPPPEPVAPPFTPMAKAPVPASPKPEPTTPISGATPPSAPLDVMLTPKQKTSPPSATRTPPPPPPEAGLTSPQTLASPKFAVPIKPPDRTTWWEDYFGDDYLESLPDVPFKQRKREADFVVASLALPDEAAVLDLAAGTGRLAFDLAARGHTVTAVDTSARLVTLGATEAKRASASVTFEHRDMRQLDYDGTFDAVICWGSSLGYSGDADDKQTLAGAFRALKPGGRLLLEMLNRDFVVGELPTRVWSEGSAGSLILDEVVFSHIDSRIEIHRSQVLADGRQTTRDLAIRLYSLHEIFQILEGMGFHVLELSGNSVTRGHFMGSLSRSLIILAGKPA